MLGRASLAMADDSSAWQERIAARVEQESLIAKDVWNEVADKGVVSSKGLGIDGRRIFTLIQKVVEDEIVKSLRAESIKKVVIVIHALQPATPLRVGDAAAGLRYSQLNISPKSRGIVRSRRAALLGYLRHDGVLISAYQKDSKLEKLAGFKEYLSVMGEHKTLLDKPIKNVPEKYWGATYLVQQLDDSIYAFSISAEQAGMVGVKTEKVVKPWNMWFGPLLDTEVSKRVVQIESFLKSEGVDIYTYLGLDGRTNE